MPTRTFPSHPSLEFLRKQAKQMLSAEKFSRPNAKLSEVQHKLANEYGFNNWAKLKTHISDSPNILEGAFKSLRAGDPIILFDDCGHEGEGDFVVADEQ